jgi:hypothetical protein
LDQQLAQSVSTQRFSMALLTRFEALVRRELVTGADPDHRQARNNGSEFTILSVATQRCWKNEETVSKVE